MNTHSSKPVMHCNVHALGLTWEGHHLPGGFRAAPTQQLICNAQFHQGSSINACKGRTAEQCTGSYVSSYERELLCHSRLATDAEGIILPLSVPKLPPTASVQLVFPFELHPHLSGSSLKFNPEQTALQYLAYNCAKNQEGGVNNLEHQMATMLLLQTMHPLIICQRWFRSCWILIIFIAKLCQESRTMVKYCPPSW